MRSGALLIIFLFAAFSCSTKRLQHDPLPTLEGFTFNQLPDQLTRNGFVFAVNKKTKQHFPVARLELATESGPAFLGNRVEVMKTSFGTLVSGLPSVSDSVKAGFAADFNKGLTAKVRFGDAVLDRSYLIDANNALEGVSRQIADRARLFQPQEYKFYVVIESVRAKSIQYTFDKSSRKMLSAVLFFNKLIRANPNYTSDRSAQYDLSFSSNDYVSVFYKVFPLTAIPAKGTYLYRAEELPDDYIRTLSQQ